MVEVDCTVSGDGETAFVAGLPPLDAAGVERAILALLSARGAMLPRRVAVLFPGAPMLLAEAWCNTRGEDGTALIALSLPSLGWVAVPRAARLYAGQARRP